MDVARLIQSITHTMGLNKHYRMDRPSRKEDCTHCIHLQYNNDGSVFCDSVFEKACLKSGYRCFKEPGGEQHDPDHRTKRERENN